MMTYYYEAGSVGQTVLLILSLLTVAVSGSSAVFLLRRRCGLRKTIGSSSIRETFDNLPAGVCFFDETGFPVLCNLAMERFSFAVCGKDIQFVTDLENCLADDFIPADGTEKDGNMFLLPDGSVRHLKKRSFTHENGSIYTRYTATDVTDLHEKRIKLMEENKQLRSVQADLQRLSANVDAIAREEEILNTKMRVHDKMGNCLMMAQECLKNDAMENIPDSIAVSWQRAVSMLKYSSDAQEEDMLSQIRKTCESVNVLFIQTGELPRQENIAYILTCAVRECVINAVRYAEAEQLYAHFTEDETAASVTVTNSGRTPGSDILESGGLSTLRSRVERAGGTMTVLSAPFFELTVVMPKGKEDAYDTGSDRGRSEDGPGKSGIGCPAE